MNYKQNSTHVFMIYLNLSCFWVKCWWSKWVLVTVNTHDISSSQDPKAYLCMEKGVVCIPNTQVWFSLYSFLHVSPKPCLSAEEWDQRYRAFSILHSDGIWIEGVDIAYIFLVEKDTIFHHLVSQNFHEKSKCVLIIGRGVPDVFTRIML